LCVYFQTGATYRVGAHGPEVRGEGEEGQDVEQGPVHDAVGQVRGGQQHHEQNHEVGVQHQQPGDGGARDAAGVPDEPHGGGGGGGDDVFGDGDAPLGRLEVAGPGPGAGPAPVLHVPASVHRALHPSSKLGATGSAAPSSGLGLSHRMPEESGGRAAVQRRGSRSGL